MSAVILCADGGSRFNPGPSACGYVVYKNQNAFKDSSEALDFALKEHPFYAGGVFLGTTTNNVAEWQGVLKGIEYIQDTVTDIGQLFIFLDSQLVVKQITGEYKVKQPHLKPLHNEVISRLSRINTWYINHIYRKDNALADAEVNAILDSQ